MAFEQRPGTGSIFRNDKKTPGSRAPEYRGSCNVAGAIYEISAWVRETKDGRKFFSLALEPKDAWRNRDSGEQRQAGDDADLDAAMPPRDSDDRY